MPAPATIRGETVVREILLSLTSSVIAGSAVWLGQRVLAYRRLARKRAFFGVADGATCRLVSPRHFSSPHVASVHRSDMAALVEIATVVNGCGGRVEVVAGTAELDGVGRMTEFSVGAPAANPRAAVHFRALLPGVVVVPFDGDATRPTFRIGATTYPPASEHAACVVLAKAYPHGSNHPVFVIAGQTAGTNLAAARLLASRYRDLLRSYGAQGRFCLVLKVVEPRAYGPDLVEIAADATADAFSGGPVHDSAPTDRGDGRADRSADSDPADLARPEAAT